MCAGAPEWSEERGYCVWATEFWEATLARELSATSRAFIATGAPGTLELAMTLSASRWVRSVLALVLLEQAASRNEANTRSRTISLPRARQGSAVDGASGDACARLDRWVPNSVEADGGPAQAAPDGDTQDKDNRVEQVTEGMLADDPRASSLDTVPMGPFHRTASREALRF